MTIHSQMAGLPKSVANDIMRLVPRGLIAHNVERQLALRVNSDPDPMLEIGDLVIHKDTKDPVPDQVCEVVRSDEDGRLDIEDPEGEMFEAVAFPADLLVFDLSPSSWDEEPEAAAA